MQSLLGFTAWIAAMLAIAVSGAAAWLMAAIGFSVTAMNCAGKLAAVQTPVNHRRAVSLAWLLLLASLLLPVVRGCGNEAVPGWRAAAVACAYQVQPPVSQPPELWVGAYVEFTWLNLANLLLILSPLLAWRIQNGKGHVYRVLLAWAATAMWCVPIGETPNTLLAGYYVWCLAALCLLASLRLRWWVLAPMAIWPVAKWLLVGR